MNKLSVRNLTKKYANNEYSAVNDVSFDLQDGKILALIGPSGCGKTTTLRMVAGLEIPDNGEIYIDDRLVSGKYRFTPPEHRGVGMIFQEHALFPHLTVAQNVAFGLQNRKNGTARQTVMEYLQMVGLESMKGRFPHEISGGERQRVALARALAPQPKLVLMDEPFNSLDADLRLQVREEIRTILQSVNASVIFVTHDQEEALFMGDRLAVIQDGKIEQIGNPEEVFHSSGTRFVAEFMGDSNFIPGEVRTDGIQTDLGLLSQKTSLPQGTRVEIAVREDDIDFEPAGEGNGTITQRIFRGSSYVYRLKLDTGQILNAFKPHTNRYSTNTRVDVRIDAGHPLSLFRDKSAVE